MARRNESYFASLALVFLLSLTVLYGCRAFDPDPVVVNRPPNTFLVGAPAETTGARYQRHLYWYGSDSDGEVIRFIYAITDSTVRDQEVPDVDEEDDRFNPALNITTLENTPERFVGWTAKTDSIFNFIVDRAETPSKDITFHIVAIDDRGAIDPTPARLHFFNNSLGNPIVQFSLSVDEGPGGAAPPEWALRWVGTPGNPIPGVSPESSEDPFVGFGQRFKIDWVASSPNGEVLGYRFKAQQGPGGFTPPDIGGEKQWDPAITSFVFNNDVSPTSIAGCDTFTAAGCDAAEVRFNSGNYSLLVKAIDRILVESEAGAGELTFQVNYPPETQLVTDAEYPLYRVLDAQGNVSFESNFAAGDTIPASAYVVVRSAGFDRLAGNAGVDPDSFCCDNVLDGSAPEVRFQTRLLLEGVEGQRVRNFRNTYSVPDAQDTIGFTTGPFDYTVDSRASDEHRRPDPTPSLFRFRSGFDPQILDIFPGSEDTLLIRQSIFPAWPENDVPYTTANASRYWDQIQYFESQSEDSTRTKVDGVYYQFRPRFEGRPDPREGAGNAAIRAWAYALNSENDPQNIIPDGAGESPDLTFFNTSPADNVWEFGDDDVIEIFVPSQIWFQPSLFEPLGGDEVRAQIGEFLRRFLGRVSLRVVARTTAPGDEYDLYANTRPGPAELVQQTIPIERLGRVSPVTEQVFHVFLGLDPTFTGSVTRYWPDF